MQKRMIWGVLCALLTMCINATAQNKSEASITGHVIDSATGEHIPYATILVRDLQTGTVTDDTGHYMLNHLPLGRHTISVSYVGYDTHEEEVQITSESSYVVHFRIAPNQTFLDEVVVTGNRYATKKRETGTIVNVAPPKLFESTLSTSPAGVLDYQPGLRMEYNCGNCGVPQLRINGLSGQYSQVLLDSRPIFSSLAMVYGLEQLPSSMIERIEVVRGGGSALFGSNAIAGTVNIITKEPTSSTAQISNLSGVGEDGHWDTNTSLNASLVSSDRKTGAYLFSMIRARDAYDRNKDGFSDSPKLDGKTVGARVYHRLNDASKITAEYHHIYEYRRGGDSLNIPTHQSNLAEQLEHHINGGSLSFDYQKGRQGLNVYLAGQHILRNSYFGTRQNLNAYGRTIDKTFNAGVQWLYRLPQLWFMPATLTLGGEYTHNSLTDRMIGYGREIHQTTNLGGVYAQNEWSNEVWGILVGARADKHSMIGKLIVSPRANVRYALNPHWTFRTSYAQGYRAPQVYDEDLHVGAVGGEVSLISLAGDLQPEYSNTVNLSADYWNMFGRWQFNLLVEGFYTSLDQVFALTENGHDSQGNLLLLRTNAAGATIAGAHAEMRLVRKDKVNLQAGFTWQQSRYKEPFSWSKTVAAQRKMLRSPNHYGYFTIDYYPANRWTASLNGVYTGPMLINHYAGYIPADREETTRSFMDISLRVAHVFSVSHNADLELSASCKNVFNQFQGDLDRTVDQDSKYIYGPAAPRMFFLGAKFSF